MPKINKMLLKLEGFQHDTSLDLNMGYHYIRFTEDESNLCTTILPWYKYNYKRITMGASNSPGISNIKQTIYSKDLNLHTYIDKILN